MKKFLTAVTLACVLSATVLAGEMPGVSPAPVSSGSQSSAVVSVVLTIVSLVIR
jgi:hypothetical protein